MHQLAVVFAELDDRAAVRTGGGMFVLVLVRLFGDGALAAGEPQPTRDSSIIKYMKRYIELVSLYSRL